MMRRFGAFKATVMAAVLLALVPLVVYAENNDISQQLREARLEGAVSTALALNPHLNPFSIAVEVDNDTAILTGRVDTDIGRELAEEVAMGIDGINQVDNRLNLDQDTDHSTEDQSDLARRLENMTLTALVKSRLLWNRNTSGLDIQVSTDNGVVTLTGEADNAAARELAERLAADTERVRGVRNHIQVRNGAGTADKAWQAVNQAENVINDAWITGKVKSSFLLSRNLRALDISVSTENGIVTLEGTVDSHEAHALAVEMAKNIRGVKEVKADALEVPGKRVNRSAIVVKTELPFS